jgi:hypothetical protein
MVSEVCPMGIAVPQKKLVRLMYYPNNGITFVWPQKTKM